jgi:hypothetical protein
MGRHWEATQETERLEAALAASQIALATVERESSSAWARLADFDARVAGRISRRGNPVPSFFCSVMLFLMDSLSVTALTKELEALQLAVNNAARALNARGNLVVSRLQDIPVRIGEIALHGVRHGAAIALTITR